MSRWAGSLVILWVLACGGDAAGFDSGREALLEVHLEVPAVSDTPTRLQLETISASCAGVPWSTRPDFTNLESSELAGGFPRLATIAIPAGPLDSLRLAFGSAEVRVGAAWILPAWEDHVVDLSVDRVLAPGESLFLVLRWMPDETAPEAPDWAPHFELRHPSHPPEGRRVYVSQSGVGSIAVVDRQLSRITATLGTGGAPRGMVFESASRRLLVAVAERDELVAIETGEHPAVNRLPLNLGDDPTRLALLTRGRRVAVLCPGRDAVVLVSTASLQTEHRIPVAPRPIAMAADARGDRLFVSSELGGRVEVLDPESGAIVASLTSVEDPGEMVVLSDGRLAVASRAGRRIEVMDPQTGVVSSTVDLCGPVVGMVGLERQNRLYAALDLCHEISILRTDPLLEVGRIEIGTAMGLIAAGEVGRWVFVPQPDNDRVLFVAANRPSELVLIETGAGPWTAVSP